MASQNIMTKINQMTGTDYKSQIGIVQMQIDNMKNIGQDRMKIDQDLTLTRVNFSSNLQHLIYCSKYL